MISTPFVAVPPPTYGGTELVVFNLVEGLRSRGHQVTLFATGDSSIDAPVEALYPGPSWPPDPYRELAHTAWAIGRIVADEGRYDLIHAHVPSALALARFVGVPLIYTVHHERDRALERFYADHPEVLEVAISSRQGKLLLGRDDCVVVHHGLDVTKYPRGPGGPGVAFLGRLSREKGPHLAIDVAREAGLCIRLGGAPHWLDRAYYETEMVPRLRQPHVESLGPLGHQAKCDLLGGSLATLCPIDWEEPFGLVLIESMLCGTPVVAFGRGAAPEIVDSGVTGFIARDAADMVRLLRDEVPRLDREACRQQARERFSREQMVAGYLRVYARALLQTGAHPQQMSCDDIDLATTRH
jgi:glycosyltransferase involved in cell wall biosynthesis